MSDFLDVLNTATADQASALLGACCGSPEWVLHMVSARPFRDSSELFDTADRVWSGLPETEWFAAFAAHPRIGQRSREVRLKPDPTGEESVVPGVSQTKAPSVASGFSRTSPAHWSEQEQAGALGAEEATRASLADANDAYEHRFGHIFIICATGKSASDMLDALRARLSSDPSDELRVAAEEQRKIIRLRLEKMLNVMSEK